MSAVTLAVSGANASLGACPTNLLWSATAAAPGQSVIAGVLAGFVFLGLVTVLSVRSAATRPAAEALKLLLSAFFGLAVVAYLFADQAADSLCVRVYAEETLNGGILGTFAIIMIIALTWLVVTYDLHTHDVLRFLRGLIYFASAFVVLLLCTSSYTYLDAVRRNGVSGAMTVLIYVIGALCWTAAVVSRSKVGGGTAVRNARPASPVGVKDVSTRPRWRRLSAADISCWSALAYLAVASVTDSVVLAVPNSAWDTTHWSVVYAMAWGSLLLPLVVLALALRALAPERSQEAPTGAGPRAVVASHTKAVTAPDAKKAGEQPVMITVSRKVLQQRFETYIVTHYTSLHNTVVSVVLAVAGLSAAGLLGSRHEDGNSYALLWLLWTASFLLCAAIFGGTVIGALVMPPLMPAVTDLVVPMLLGVGEFVLFGVLARQATGLDKPVEIIEAWYIAFAAVSVCATLAVNRAMRFFRHAVYPPDISSPVNDYRYKRLPWDAKGAVFGAMLAAFGAVATAVGTKWLEYAIALLIIAALLAVLIGHARSALILRAAAAPTVSDTEASESREATPRSPNGDTIAETSDFPAEPVT